MINALTWILITILILLVILIIFLVVDQVQRKKKDDIYKQRMEIMEIQIRNYMELNIEIDT